MGRGHEDGAIVFITIKIVQQGREWLVQANVARHVAVAGGCGGHAQRHPAVGSVAHRAVLAAHAVGAAAKTAGVAADDQGQFQDQFVAARDVHIDLEKQA